MASTKQVCLSILKTTFVFLFGVTLTCNANELKACGFDAIYQFGDSMSDTGTSMVVFPRAQHARLPYGISLGKATGRPSDGLILIDYIAKSAGLPFLEPYLNPNMTFRHGANFAFAGVTALPIEVLKQFNGDLLFRRSLSAQLGYMDTLLKTRICNHTEDCRQKLKSSLFMVGEIGHNDYSVGFFLANMTPAEVKVKLVPLVVQAIKDAIVRVIKFGASRIVVPGHFQLGCSPSYFIQFKQNSSEAYDKNGCIKDINGVFEYHNEQLQIAIAEVQKQNPHVIIAYADYYKSYQWVLDRFDQLGFKDLQKGCCGPPPIDCGSANSTVCANPAQSIYWDGGHYSQAANHYISQQFIADIFPKLRCGKSV